MCTPSPNNRTRWAPSDAQRLTLENSYANSAFPDLAARQALANLCALGLTIDALFLSL